MKKYIWLVDIFKRYLLIYILALLLSSITTVLAILPASVHGKIVDDVIINGQNNLLVKYMLIIFAIVMSKSLIRLVHQMFFEFASQGIMYDIRMRFFKKFGTMESEFFDKIPAGSIMNRMTGDLEAVREFFSHIINAIYGNITIFLISFIILFRINVKLTLSFLILIVPISLITVRLRYKGRKLFPVIRQKLSELTIVVRENIEANRLVKSFCREGYEIDKFQHKSDAYRDSHIAASRVWAKYIPILDSLSGAFVVFLIFIGGSMVMTGEMTLGELVVFNNLIWALNDPVRQLGFNLLGAQRFKTSIDKFNEMEEYNPKIKYIEHKTQNINWHGNIEFQNISFAYQNKNVLENINLHIKSGSKVGILGPTGSGKTTFANLIKRFYDVSSGAILIDGVNIKDLNIRELRDNVGLSMQNVFLFSDSIKGNITFARPDATDDMISEVSNMADVDTFAKNMNEGYDTVIGEYGVGLSGGQRQRVALARLLITKPSIFILDSATNALDVLTESYILEYLNKFKGNVIQIIIAHRISSIMDSDIILVLENGKITQRGVHKELLKEDGYYRNTYNIQKS